MHSKCWKLKIDCKIQWQHLLCQQEVWHGVLLSCSTGDEAMLWHPAPHKKMRQGTQELLSSTNTTVFMETIFYGKGQNWQGIVNFVSVKSQFYIFLYFIFMQTHFFSSERVFNWVFFLYWLWIIPNERIKSILTCPKPILLWILVKLEVWKSESGDQLSACSYTNSLESYMLREHQKLENSNLHKVG